MEKNPHYYWKNLTLANMLKNIKAKEIVRCRDCRHSRACQHSADPDWFCADGERKDDDD